MNRKLLLLLGRSFSRLGNDFFEVNFQDRRGILDLLLHIADGLARQTGFLRQHVQGMAALFGLNLSRKTAL